MAAFKTTGDIHKTSITKKTQYYCSNISEGRIWATTTFANVDSDVIRIFILRLIHKFEADGLSVETEVLFLLDNASYHTSGIVRRFFEIYNLNIAWTAPYAYESSPVETLFSRLKRSELNENNIKLTGK